jgi:hypothetical protein
MKFFQIHEKQFDPHSSKGALEETGSFVIDKYVGRDTDFDVFTLNKDHGFIKSITVADRRGRQYRDVFYDKANYHIIQAYRVPFQEVSRVMVKSEFPTIGINQLSKNPHHQPIVGRLRPHY